MSNQKNQTLKGFRDILPEEMTIRQRVISILRQTFESFGFVPFSTPTLEYADTLLRKYGEEADKMVYTFKDRGDRNIGLRYDLTVPISRALANHQHQIKFPFKRYQIENVFRTDKPQRGRYREFTQCDIDIFGEPSRLADAEIILIIYTALKKLGFKDFVININSRKVAINLLNQLGIKDEDQQQAILQSIDKLDKKDQPAVKKELKNKGIDQDLITKIFESFNNAQPDDELNQIFDFLEQNNVPEEFYTFNPTMVRGLDYYTGPIFETTVTKPDIGSVTGGGRYDNLVQQLGGPEITGTGTTIGLERIVEVIKDQNLWPNVTATKTKVLVTVFSPETTTEAFKTAQELRQSGVNTELYLNPKDNLGDQLDYANDKNIPYTIIIGPEEIDNKVVALKNMESGEQKSLPLKEIITQLTQQ